MTRSLERKTRSNVRTSGRSPAGQEREQESFEGEAAEESEQVHVTPRERAVLTNLTQGACNKSIAAALGCSVRTVEFHLSNLMRKTGFSSRLELVVWNTRRSR